MKGVYAKGFLILECTWQDMRLASQAMQRESTPELLAANNTAPGIFCSAQAFSNVSSIEGTVSTLEEQIEGAAR